MSADAANHTEKNLGICGGKQKRKTADKIQYSAEDCFRYGTVLILDEIHFTYNLYSNKLNSAAKNPVYSLDEAILLCGIKPFVINDANCFMPVASVPEVVPGHF